jgi:hypothetical protein
VPKSNLESVEKRQNVGVAQGFEPLHGALCHFKELRPIFGIEAEHGHLVSSPLKKQKSSFTVSRNNTNATNFFLSLVDAP